jgi:hypothetical protein
MTYLFKLSRRVSRLKRATLLVTAAAFGCSEGDQADFLTPDPGQITQVLTSVRVEPRVVSVRAGDPIQFSVVGLSNHGKEMPASVDWYASRGTITADGRYVADASGLVSVVARVRGQSIADSAKVGVWNLPTDIMKVRVFPDSTVVQAAESLSLLAVTEHADGTQSTDASVTWKTTGGSVGSDGTYAAPSTPGTYTVMAVASNGVLGNSRVVVKPRDRALASLIVTPDRASLTTGGSLQMTATPVWADGSTGGDVEVSWSSTGGTINANGLYKAGSTPGVYAIIGRHKRSTAADTATVTVASPSIVRLSLSPSNPSLSTGATVQMTAQARMSDSTWKTVSVVWQATGGAITSTGLYTAGSTGGTFQIKATASGTSVTESEPVTVTQATVSLLQVTVGPSSASVASGTSKQFAAAGTWSDGSTSTPSVAWSATGGSITSGGLYTAGSAQGGYRVIATAANGKADTSDVTVTAPSLLTLSMTPTNVTLLAGASQQFTVSGTWSNGTTSSPTVQYSAAGGTMSASGLYTAGTAAGTYAVVATQQGGTLADTSYVTINVSTPSLSSLSLTPASATLASGGGLQLVVTGTWSDGSTSAPSVTYNANGGTVTSAGFYTASLTSGSYRVIAAQVGGTKADTSYISVTGPATLTSLHISPLSSTVSAGGAKQYAATATWSDGSTTVPSLAWSATGGAVSSGGLYVAGSVGGSYKVSATHQGGSLTANADVVIDAPTLTSLVVSPGSKTLAPAGTQQFAASATWSNGSTTAPALTWSATGGSITQSGMYTAGSTSGSYRVIATASGGAKADTAEVTIASSTVTLTSITVAPATVSLQTGNTQQFTATGQMSNGTTGSPSVTWTATGGTISTGGLYTAGQMIGNFLVVATCSSCGLADTSFVTVTSASGPVLQAVELTPASAIVPTGGTQAFQAVGRMSDGTTSAVQVNWNAAGGTIANGVYTAGSTIGTYRVIATQMGGTKADTSLVTIVLSASGGSLYPNMTGSGWTTLLDLPFNTTGEMSTYDNGVVVADPRAPTTNKVHRSYWRAGTPYVGEGSKFAEKGISASFREMYFAFDMELSANFKAHSVINKVVYPYRKTGTGNSGSFVWGFTPGVGSQTTAPVQLIMGTQGFLTATNKRANVNVATSTMDRGVRYRIEIYAKQNTPGVANGVFKMWKNGVLHMEYYDCDYSGATDPGLWAYSRLVNYAGGSGSDGTLVEDQWVDNDRLFVGLRQ